MKKVSIIIPIYNAEKFLSQCLDTVINQTYKNLEIILVNDGSKDNSYTLCKQYQKQDSRIILLSYTNHGASYARNKGLENSTGDYVVFVDADDSIDKNYIEAFMKVVMDNEYDLVFCGYKEIENGINNIVLTGKEKKELTGILKKDYKNIEKFLITPWVKLYKNNIIKNHKIEFPEDFIIAEDQVFNSMYLRYVKTYKYIDKPLYNYKKQNNNSLTSIRNIKAFNCDLKFLKIKKIFFEEMEIEERERLLGEWAIVLIHLYAFVSNDNKNKYNSYKERVRNIRKEISLNFKPNTFKQKIVLFCLKRNFIFPIYFYNYIKRYIKI